MLNSNILRLVHFVVLFSSLHVKVTAGFVFPSQGSNTNLMKCKKVSYPKGSVFLQNRLCQLDYHCKTTEQTSWRLHEEVMRMMSMLCNRQRGYGGQVMEMSNRIYQKQNQRKQNLMQW